MNGSERLHALDAVRALALLLGVALHGAVPYVPGFPGWASDTPSTGLTVMFYVIHIFRMTVFFFIAGLFARLALQRKGTTTFVRDRLTRVGLPLVGGWLVLMPGMGIVLAVGAAIAGTAANTQPAVAPQVPESALMAVVTLFPWGHLWFLYMLLGFYAVALAARGAVHRVDKRDAIASLADRVTRWVMQSHLAPLVLGAPALALFLTNPDWRMWFGVPSPIQGFIPDRLSWFSFAFAFVFGWMLHRQIELIRVWQRRWALNMGIALAATAGCLAIAGPTPIDAAAAPGLMTAAYAVLYAVSIWAWIAGILGVALTFLSEHSVTRRYLADASYWIYLVHVLPIMATHVALTRMAWPPALEFLIVVGIATGVCLATYQVFVRHTFIGVVLNGRRGGSAVQPPAAAAAPGAAVT